QLGCAAIGQPVVDMAGPPFGLDEAVPAQHGQMLRQTGGLAFGVGLEIGDADLLGAGEQLEDADAPGVGEVLEEVRLDLVQGTLRMIQWHDESIISGGQKGATSVSTSGQPGGCVRPGGGPVQSEKFSATSAAMDFASSELGPSAENTALR